MELIDKRMKIDELRQRFDDSARTYLTQEEIRTVTHVRTLAETALDGIIQPSGDPLAARSLGMAVTLMGLRADPAAIAAALLYIPYDEKRLTAEAIGQDSKIPAETLTLMDGVRTVSGHTFRANRGTQPESFRKLILTLAKDLRVVLVKLSFRLVRMRGLQYEPEDERRRYARESMDIYAPLANRLGLNRIKSELEDLSFRFLDPDRYQKLKTLLARKKSQRENYIEYVRHELLKILHENEIKGEVSGRFKHFWSIQKKMERRGIDFDELYDITAFRIIVDTIAQCYQLLGVVHHKWRPIPGTFDDYIAMPKPNGYQSLHTAVIGPKGERIEIQIRTRKMHEIAEHGVAAHWRYKETGRSDFSPDTVQQFGWMREAMAANGQDMNERVMESLRTDLFDDEVFVFTPTGDVRALPKGATPLDFAYSIHSRIGETCVGAKVNGRIVPLDHQLNNGDNIEVLTNPRGRPSADWLEIPRTNRARQKIRHYLGEARRERERNLGREVLEKACKEREVSLARLLKDEKRLAKALDKLKYRLIEEVFLALGRGAVGVGEVMAALAPETMEKDTEPATTPVEDELLSLPKTVDVKRGSSGILVDGLPDMMIHYARCCNPVVGDGIVGYITRGRGVTIHRDNCERLQSIEKERLIDVSWAMSPHQTMPVKIRVTAEDRSGLLAHIGDIFKKFGINVMSAHVSTGEGQGQMFFTITVHSLDELNRVTDTIRSARGVLNVSRVADAIER